MTTNRKVQAEIDRTLKKVQEGIEVFEAMWDKVHSAPNQIQKERFEAELKKEIKKLQRLREQIKSWQSSTDIKDKRTIDASRKLIESKMEMFKVCEKETKTKAYSKEGLALPSKTDPGEIAKAKTIDWINDAIQALNDAVDVIEVELETADVKKVNVKKGGEGGGLANTLIRHKYHIMKLEQVLRMMDNDELEPGDVDEIEEGVQGYIDARGDMTQDDEEGIYDSLDLPALEIGTPGQSNFDDDDDPVPVKVVRKVDPPKPTVVKPLPPAVTVQAKAPLVPAMVKTMPIQQPLAKVQNATSPNDSSPKGPSGALAAKKMPQLPPPAAEPKKVAAAPPATVAPPKAPSQLGTQPQATQPKSVVAASPANPKTPVVAPIQRAVAKVPNSPSPVVSRSSGQFDEDPADTAPPKDDTFWSDTSMPHPGEAQSPIGQEAASRDVGAVGGKATNEWASKQTAAARIQSAQAATVPATASPIGASPPNQSTTTAGPPPSSPVQHPAVRLERAQAMKMLETSYRNLPHPTDCEKAKPYMPPNPYRTMSFYPQVPHPIFNTPEVFGKFEADTLFFIFYYQQATYQQYLAAVELKKQSWRYHKKYLTWFQRHEKPKAATEDYEVGNYLYFDYESGWSQRVKQEFTFKYSYLEDELLVP